MDPTPLTAQPHDGGGVLTVAHELPHPQSHELVETAPPAAIDPESGPVLLSEQVAGHLGSFMRTSDATICKLRDDSEHTSYEKLITDPDLAPLLPRLYGTQTVEDKVYLELEDLQAGLPYTASCMFDLKIGYQTFQADIDGYLKPKESYHANAVKAKYEEFLTADELEAGKISKARWMTLNNMVSSSSELGFRIDGARIGQTLVRLKPKAKTTAMLEALLKHVSNSSVEDLTEQIKNMHKRLASSELFCSHNLYGSSLLLVICGSVVRLKMIDVRSLIPRDHRCNHTVAETDLPLPPDTLEDGYLTGLGNLATFLESVLAKRCTST